MITGINYKLGICTAIIGFASFGIGLVLAQNSQVIIEIKDGYRFIESNAIPNHTTGRFPNRDNPNHIQAQSYHFRMPLTPDMRSKPYPFDQRTWFGIALNGIAFDPATAEFWNDNRDSKWNYDAITGGINLGLDQNNAHVQPDGTYHYHAIPEVLLKVDEKSRHSNLIGYAADGVPIYARYGFDLKSESGNLNEVKVKELISSYRIKSGPRGEGSNAPSGNYDGRFSKDWEYVEGLGDLDECNGRFGATPAAPNGEYAYFLTDQFPFIPRCFMAMPDSSFKKPKPTNGFGQRPPDGKRLSDGKRPPPRDGMFPPPPPQ